MSIKKNKGFTLIELLIVVLLLGIISGVVLGLLNSAGLRQKARDGQRIADLKKIQSALELFFLDNRDYPTSSSWLKITSTNSIGALVPNYISALPIDPAQSGGSTTPCSMGASEHSYFYRTNAAGTAYIVATRMDVSSPTACSTLTNWSTWCASTPSNCYGVQNP